jgi:defect in organelle trafficking protein DotD
VYIKKIFTISFSLIAIFLVGCSSKPDVAVEGDDLDVRRAEVKLANSSESISRSLQELAAIERAVHPAAKIPNPLNPEMIGMAQIASIDWNGPIGPLVNKIASISKYKVRVLGNLPAIPIIVSITARNTLLADILRDANFQCNGRANIAVYVSNRIIELRYAKT